MISLSVLAVILKHYITQPNVTSIRRLHAHPERHIIAGIERTVGPVTGRRRRPRISAAGGHRAEATSDSVCRITDLERESAVRGVRSVGGNGRWRRKASKVRWYWDLDYHIIALVTRLCSSPFVVVRPVSRIETTGHRAVIVGTTAWIEYGTGEFGCQEYTAAMTSRTS